MKKFLCLFIFLFLTQCDNSSQNNNALRKIEQHKPAFNCDPFESVCGDGFDNDCDGSSDCEDPDCFNSLECPCNLDEFCDEGENCRLCPHDCISVNMSVCGNGVCESGDGENCKTCSFDCNGSETGTYCCGPVCNDARCNDDYVSCIEEAVGNNCCGNGVCEVREDTCNCFIDCLNDYAPCLCGNGICEPGEGCFVCADCAGNLLGRPEEIFCCGNGILEGPEGDGSICDGNF